MYLILDCSQKMKFCSSSEYDDVQWLLAVADFECLPCKSWRNLKLYLSTHCCSCLLVKERKKEKKKEWLVLLLKFIALMLNILSQLLCFLFLIFWFLCSILLWVFWTNLSCLPGVLSSSSTCLCFFIETT